MNAQDRNLQEWFVQLRMGAVQPPRFQRFEAWAAGGHVHGRDPRIRVLVVVVDLVE